MITKLYTRRYMKVLIPTVFSTIIIYLLFYVLTDLGYSRERLISGPIGLPFYIESAINLFIIPISVFLNQCDKIYGIR